MDPQPPAGKFKAPEPAELSKLLPGYEVSDLIASGGIGAVYLARQISLDRNVAIKILSTELGAGPGFRSSFRAEAKAMAHLRHPNLIAVHDFGEVDGYLFLVMDFVNGKSLFQSAHGKAIEETMAARLMHAICLGIAHAHEEDIIHRDLKPANILLDSRKQPRIGDFGLARPTDSHEGEAMAFGTPGYTAPEVMANSAAASKRSDVFSLGVMLYELLTGELPKKHYQPPSRHYEIDPRFDKIVRRALHPAPAMRYADAGELAREIASLRASLEKSASENPDRGTRRSGLRTDPDAETAAPTGALKSSEAHKHVLVRNVVIIVILLFAIMFMLSAYNRKRNEITRKNKVAAEQTPSPTPLPANWLTTLQSAPSHETPSRPAALRSPLDPVAEEPLDLAGLQPSLAQGKRDRFPPDAREFGAGKIYPVGTPMTWPEASAFAEAHGGHLVTLPGDEQKRAIANLIPGGTTVWLGGGTTGPASFGWVDGSAWALSTRPPVGHGGYLSMTRNGVLRTADASEKHPFFIQWHMNGTNPGSTAAQWQRLNASPGQGDPVLPPGILNDGKRRYLISPGTRTWEEASKLARAAGGHLAVPSDQSEWEYFQSAFAKSLPPGGRAWLGGRYAKGAWRWITGERWSIQAWVHRPPQPNEVARTALCLVPAAEGYGWDNANPADEQAASAFVVEWSRDQDATASPSPSLPVEWLQLRARAARRIEKELTSYQQKIEENGKALHKDLETWHNNLDLRIREKQADAVSRARETITASGRIDEGKLLRLPSVHEDIGAVCNGHLIQQRRLDSDHENLLDDLRAAYVKELRAKQVEAQADRLLEVIVAIEQEIRICEIDGQPVHENLEADQ